MPFEKYEMYGNKNEKKYEYEYEYEYEHEYEKRINGNTFEKHQCRKL